jgi:hypothetical protein
MIAKLLPPPLARYFARLARWIAPDQNALLEAFVLAEIANATGTCPWSTATSADAADEVGQEIHDCQKE